VLVIKAAAVNVLKYHFQYILKIPLLEYLFRTPLSNTCSKYSLKMPLLNMN